KLEVRVNRRILFKSPILSCLVIGKRIVIKRPCNVSHAWLKYFVSSQAVLFVLTHKAIIAFASIKYSSPHRRADTDNIGHEDFLASSVPLSVKISWTDIISFLVSASSFRITDCSDNHFSSSWVFFFSVKGVFDILSILVFSPL